MYRTSLPANTGMLFVFGSDGPVDFWMKNTLIPLDMVFVAADGTVRKVFARVPVVSPALPDGRIPLEESSGQYVIELPAGEAAADGIVPGTKLTDVTRSTRSETRRCPNCPRSRPSFAVSPTPSSENDRRCERAPAKMAQAPPRVRFERALRGERIAGLPGVESTRSWRWDRRSLVTSLRMTGRLVVQRPRDATIPGRTSSCGSPTASV